MSAENIENIGQMELDSVSVIPEIDSLLNSA